jgi:hypothetical protein
MTLGAAILRPQGLEEAPAHGPGRAADLAFAFFESLMADPEGATATFEALGASGAEALPAFLVSRRERMRKAEGKLRKIFRPISDLITDFLDGIGESVSASLPAGFMALKGMLALARKESVTRMLRDLIETARTDVGVDGPAVEALFRDCVEGAVRRLQAAVQGGDLSEAALKRFEWGLNLRHIEHLILEELDWPELDPDLLIDAVAKLYDRNGFGGILDRIGKVLDAAATLSGPIGLILQTMMEKRVSASAGGSVGAAAAGDAPSPPSVGPAASENTKPVSWYATWILRSESRCDIPEGATSIATIPAVTFNCISPRGMESLAYHTLWISDLAELTLHFISVEQEDIASNVLNAMWSSSNLAVAWIDDFSVPGYAQWALSSFMTLMGGMESVRCSGPDDAVYPIIEILGDAAETAFYKRWTWLLREFTLSAVTLSNIDSDAYDKWKKEYEKETPLFEYLALEERLKEPDLPPGMRVTLELNRDAAQEYARDALFAVRQGNHNQFHGVVYGLGEIGAIILPAWLAEHDRANYGLHDKGVDELMAGKIFGGMGVAMGFRAGAVLLSALMARRLPDDVKGAVLSTVLLANERYLWNPRDWGTAELTGRTFWLITNLGLEWVWQIVYLYLFTNGHTDDGKFAFINGSDLEVSFHGFPEDRASSPYKLPWDEEDKRQCVQNPMGIWNHYPENGFTYAIDYNHDAGSDVLASREGVIVNLDDTNPNNAKPKNHIEILALSQVPQGTPGAMEPVPAPADTKYGDGSDIDDGTLFPPYWDVHGKFWPNLPPTMSLHPSAAILPDENDARSAMKKDLYFRFIDPDVDRGLAGRSYLDGAFFADGVTPIPFGVVFAPDAPVPPTLITPMYPFGTTFWPIQKNFVRNPFPDGSVKEAGFALAAGATYIDDGEIPRPLDSKQEPLFKDGNGDALGFTIPPDCGKTPDHLPRPNRATPLYLPGTEFVDFSGVDTHYFMPGTRYVPVGTVLRDLPEGLKSDDVLEEKVLCTWMVPVALFFMEYQHGIQNYTRISLSPASTPGQPEGPLTDVFDTNDLTRILGRYVEQGRVIMLSGDTGTSLFNHLHVQAHADSSEHDRPKFTAPFVYADVKHGVQHGFREALQDPGVPRAMSWYKSENKKRT